MPKEFGRNRRVSEFIKQEIAVLIQKEFPIQHYGMLTVTTVDVSPDLKNAKIYVTALSEKLSKAEVMDALNEQAGHFRHEIASMMTSKRVPALTFRYDETIERAQRLDAIIDSVTNKKDQME